jgi:hypothetical protein
MEEALLGLEEEVMMAEFPEDDVGETFQFVFCVSVDKDIIHVHDYPSISDFFFEYAVHQSLERGRRVGEAKEHYGGLEKSFVGNESCLPLVSVLDPHVVVSPSYVYLGEVLGSFELVEEVGDSREGIGIPDGSLVKLLVVLTGSKGSVLLLDEEKGGGLGRDRGADVSFLQVVFDKGVELAIFSRRKTVNLSPLWFEVGFEIYTVIPGSRSGKAGCGFFVEHGKVLMILARDAFSQGSEVLLGVLFCQVL